MVMAVDCVLFSSLTDYLFDLSEYLCSTTLRCVHTIVFTHIWCSALCLCMSIFVRVCACVSVCACACACACVVMWVDVYWYCCMCGCQLVYIAC